MNTKRYIHLGGDISVLFSDIAGIFDIEKLTEYKSGKELLNSAQKSGRIFYCYTNVSYIIPRSFTVMKDNRIFISAVSAATIFDRCNIVF